MKAPQLFCGALALAVAVTACHTPTSKAEVKQTATDAAADLSDFWLSTMVHSKFIADRDIKATNISVSSHDGVVTLKGRVLNEPMRDLAVAITQHTNGVKQVVNELGVEIGGPTRNEATPGAVVTSGSVNSAPAETPPVDDNRITSSIQSKFYVDDRIRTRRLNVTSENGVVTLSGEVGDDTERAQALQLARSTEGVSRVEDSLTIAVASTAAPASAPADADQALSTRIHSQLASD